LPLALAPGAAYQFEAMTWCAFPMTKRQIKSFLVVILGGAARRYILQKPCGKSFRFNQIAYPVPNGEIEIGFHRMRPLIVKF